MTRERKPSVGRRAGLSILDQLLYSLSNFALTVLVARSSSVREFGLYSIILATYLIGSAINRGLVSEPLIVRFSAERFVTWRGDAASGLSVTLSFAIAGSLICISIAPFLSGDAKGPVLMFALMLPALFMQDTLRFVAIGSGRPAVALISDAVASLGVVYIAISILYLAPPTLSELVGAWAGGAAAGALAAIAALRIRILANPSLWISRQRFLASRYGAENLVSQGTQQASAYVVAAVSGLADAAALRGAQTIFSPSAVLSQGVQAGVTPELVRIASQSTRKLLRWTVMVGATLSLTQLVWGGAAILLGQEFGGRLFGATWIAARALVPFLLIAQAASAASMGALTGIRAIGAADHSLGARLTTAALGLFASIIGAISAGAYGVAIAAAVSAPLQALIWWSLFLRALRSFRRTTTIARVRARWELLVDPSFASDATPGVVFSADA